MKLLTLPLVMLIALAVSCGGGDDDSTTGAIPTSDSSVPATQRPSGDASAPTQAPTDGGGSAQAAGGGGSLTLGDQVIELNSTRCFLQEQDVSGSPGKILFTGISAGSLATGEEIAVDVSRYDEDSLFTGDEVTVDVGDPFGDDFYSWEARADLGTIQQDGSTLRAEGLTFTHSEDFTEVTGDFELRC